MRISPKISAIVLGQTKPIKLLIQRAGALDLMPYLAASGASRIVYVSCDLTLARDSAELTKQGYRLARLGMLDMFPHTAHLESMALFVRNS